MGLSRRSFLDTSLASVAGLVLVSQAAIDQALAVLVTMGGEMRDVSLEVSTDRTLFRAEAYTYHAEYIAKTPELYIPETLGKLKLGAGIDGQSYIRAPPRRTGGRSGTACLDGSRTRRSCPGWSPS